jgi:hypothetical protein
VLTRRTIVLLACALGAATRAFAVDVPRDGADAHLGVQNCSGAPCHGSGAPRVDLDVLGNEHTTWLRRDAHSRAWEVLTHPASQRIADKLGIADPTSARQCLSCHTDAWDLGASPERIVQQEEGVTCEACHGGSQRWLVPHAQRAASHQKNLALGMYPTNDPVARAELCLSCHFGNSKKFVKHKMMGAGHPRLSFELDTFTQLQPAHFRIDTDYERRKGTVPSPAVFWAVGQAVQVREILTALADPQIGRDGIWPEYALFDCHACHHPMSDKRWQPRVGTGLTARPGIARLNDANFLMLGRVLAVTDPKAAARFRDNTLALHAAASAGKGNVVEVAQRMRAVVGDMIPALAQTEFTESQVRQLAANIVREGLAGEYRDYAAAEQSVMAVQALASTLDRMNVLGPDRTAKLKRINDEIGALLAVTSHDEAYQPEKLRACLERVRSSLE